ncbi:hypothetical protein [Phenylobacterium sp.]|jgi:hypothetical protein|uniref:hypothetical protein n=1 Tax=Phenylobacterium sp. TaxID=1871053 RepID=UPI002F95D1F1
MSEAAAPGFSASDAALEGFRLIGRHWRVVVGWSLFNLLAWIAMILVSAVVLLILVAVAGEGASAAYAAPVGGAVYLLGLVLIGAILACGVFRLMLRPEEPAFLHLRLGPDELRNAALGLVALTAMAILVAVGVALARAMGAGGLAVRIILWVAVFGIALWLFLRLCLAWPWTFAERRLSIRAAWRTTGGRAWALLGMWVLNLCLVAMVGLVLWLAMFVLTGAATGFEGLLSSLSDAEQMEAQPGRYLLQLFVQVLLGPFFTVLATAPVVAAYRALRPES